MSDKALIIFVKNPIKGNVKTRIAAEIGDERAQAIYLKLMEFTRHLAEQVDCIRYLYYSDFVQDDQWSTESFRKKVQTSGKLGKRMQTAFEEILLHHQKVIIIGSDCLELTADLIEKGFSKLEEYDAVLGPTADGGYYLLGLKKVYAQLFTNISWSTPTVLQMTKRRMQDLKLNFTLLPCLSDIDYYSDWERHLKKVQKSESQSKS